MQEKNPRRGAGPQDCGKLPFLIRRDGVWLYRGSPVKRKALVCLFASALTRDEKGLFWLTTPSECGTIEVEDTPFTAISLQWCGAGRQQELVFRTNVDQIVELGPDHGLRMDWEKHQGECEGVSPPAVLVRPGAGKFPIEARLSRPVWYELAALAEPGVWRGKSCFGVWSRGLFFPLSCGTSCHDAGC
ncbi:DUF1285 domain-containing protein [Acetobacter sp. AN02]|uniref:DUF1285 domain-containing protein n=1 Tax=Acetobacter sp. AN02 TaxID=2894186 RepID=UPI0024344FE8|nr:DUF1285 domain-containing protein [Acetobacter sp. AN02]MDG6094431.1 DUF1285 domain-containing protein [Acetobacter sp. AN02]